MNQPFDPFELLRELNPIDPADLHGEASSARAQEALDRILSDSATSKGRRQSRPRLPRRRSTYVLVLAALAVGVTTAAWALTRAPTKTLTVGCYASADLQARTVVVPAEDRSPTATCAAIWERGDFGSPTTPKLQACVLPSGATGVFPSPDGQTCQQLRLAPVTPSPPAPPHRHTGPGGHSPAQRSASARTLKNKLVDAFLAKPCMNEQQATATIRDELRKLRLSNWDVKTNGPFSPARPCASLAFDEDQHLVLLVPTPTRP